MIERKKQFPLMLSEYEHKQLRLLAGDIDIGMGKYVRDKVFNDDLEIMKYKSIMSMIDIGLKSLKYLVDGLPRNTTNERVMEEVDNLIEFLEDK